MSASDSISVVIPVYNGERYLAQAINSVLRQTLAACECIVIDDGSTDSTEAVAREFGDAITYERQMNSGVSVARNRGVERSSGSLIAFLDHDDQWLPSKLEAQSAAMRLSSADMVLCGVTVVDSSGVGLGVRRLHAPNDLLAGLLTFDGTESVSCSSAGLVSRTFLDRVGGFDPALGTSADLDLLIRVLLEGSLDYVDESLVLYRLHDSNMSRSVSATERDMLHLYGKVFADPALPDRIRRDRRHCYARLYRMLAGSYLRAGLHRAALRTLTAALLRDPLLLVDQTRKRGPLSRWTAGG